MMIFNEVPGHPCYHQVAGEVYAGYIAEVGSKADHRQAAEPLQKVFLVVHCSGLRPSKEQKTVQIVLLYVVENHIHLMGKLICDM